MSGIEKKKIETQIKWWRETDHQGMDIDKYLFIPIMEALGDDVNDILEYLGNLDIETLDYISGIFEYIYGKFMTEHVWDELKKLENKIKRWGEEKKHTV